MTRKRVFQSVTVVTVLLTLTAAVNACTYFFLKAKDGSVVSGRSMEFYSKLGEKIDCVPEGTEFTSHAPEGAVPLKWKNSYGFVGVSHFNRKQYSEALNQKGLSAGSLWFADVQYPAVNPGDTVIDVADVVGWIVGSFQTIDELKSALAGVKIASVKHPDLGTILPLHYYATDAGGNSAVLECIDEKLKIWDNSGNGVMTNEPHLGWHLHNLRFYSNVKALDFPAPELSDEKWSLGTGLLGIPGDYTSASRFVKTSVFKFLAAPSKDADAAVSTALHILNTVDIPEGPQLWIQGQTGKVQATYWITVFDHSNRRFYYRTYENQNVGRIDLDKLNFKEGAPYRSIELFGGQGFIDKTETFN